MEFASKGKNDLRNWDAFIRLLRARSSTPIKKNNTYLYLFGLKMCMVQNNFKQEQDLESFNCIDPQVI